jgi:heme exporter protein C
MILFKSLLAPKNFCRFSQRLLPGLQVLFIVSLAYGLWGGLVKAPADAVQGDGFRIIYLHVPCAFLSLGVYSVMALSAALGIIFRLKIAFSLMRHSISLGATFTLLALISGSLWGIPMWGTWWLWDARLTSELLLLFLYLSLWLFQSAVTHKKTGERAVAILVLIGFVDIPIIHYSVYWWNTLHQGATFKIFSPSTIDSSMAYPLFAMLLSFSSYYAIVLILRILREYHLQQQKPLTWTPHAGNNKTFF